jgi:hypothetical protein
MAADLLDTSVVIDWHDRQSPTSYRKASRFPPSPPLN